VLDIHGVSLVGILGEVNRIAVKDTCIEGAGWYAG